jgi:uncharacterized protein YkwD
VIEVTRIVVLPSLDEVLETAPTAVPAGVGGEEGNAQAIEIAPTVAAPEPVAAGGGASTSETPPTPVPSANARQATATAVPAADPTPIPPPGGSASDATFEESVAELINQQRSANGLPALSLVSELTLAARRHSQDMAAANNTTHTGSDGSDGGQRINDAGYEWSAWDEAIGWGFADPAGVVDWWIEDAVHRPILLSDEFTEFGVGYYRDPNSQWGHYWTAKFGTR